MDAAGDLGDPVTNPPTRLTTNGASDQVPRWSSDGSKILFSSNRDDAFYEIYTMDATGDAGGTIAPTRLTNNPTSDNEAHWGQAANFVLVPSSTGTGNIKFETDAGIFSNSQSVDESTIPLVGKPPRTIFPHGFADWTVIGLADGQTVTSTITFPSDIHIGTKYWKFNGVTWLDVTSLVGSNNGDNVITLSITDGGLGDLDNTVNGQIVDPGGIGITFTLDGAIVFETTRDGNDEIYIMDTFGSGKINLSNNPATDERPKLSPDGTKIVFQSDRDNPGSGIFEIYVMDVDGSNPTNISNDLASNDREAFWSPDGTQIVFVSNTNALGTNSDGDLELFMMDSDGNNLVQLTFNDEPEYDPSWSPDGTKIVYGSEFEQPSEDDGEIFWIGVDSNGATTNPIQLTTNTAFEFQPRWEPNSEGIVYISNFGGGQDIWRKSPLTAAPVEIIANGLTYGNPTVSPDGNKITYLGDGEIRRAVYPSGANELLLTTNGASPFDHFPHWGRSADTQIIQSASGTGPIVLTTSAGQFQSASAIAENTLPTAGKPARTLFVHDFVDWTVTGLVPGQTIQVNNDVFI